MDNFLLALMVGAIIATSTQVDGKFLRSDANSTATTEEDTAAAPDTAATIVRLHFNETCCEAKGVPADCMGLCREKVESRSLMERAIQMVMPVDMCAEHKDVITTCMIQEVHCEWNDWELGECSVTCGGGARINTRTKAVEEANGGICEGEASIEDVCNTDVCPPVHCEWGDWVAGECSVTCGTGTQTNTREKTVEEHDGGTCTGQYTEEVECDMVPCPIHCEWDEWIEGECNKDCGGGMQTNTRVPKVKEQHGGDKCPGNATIDVSCNVHECPVDCEWGNWTIGECPVTCGGGIQIDTREKTQEELFGGVPCAGEATAEIECNPAPCPVNCTWKEWELGECSLTCGNGTRTNTRSKLVEEEHGGLCEGEATIQDDCNMMVCPPVHCEWDEWVLGECSKTCGTGTRRNTRVKLVEESHGGTCDGQEAEIDQCNTDPCPIDCVWDEWKNGTCSKTCGGGLLESTRGPSVDEAHGGKPCTGDSLISLSCNVDECPVNCTWNEWTIGECSKTCDHGVQKDTRDKFVEEQFGGTCEGNATRESDCFIKDCPIVFHFDEACCTAAGVPDQCMGLCREKLPNRQIEVILPVNECAEYPDKIRSCLSSEGGEDIKDFAHVRSFDEISLPVAQMRVLEEL